jgi:hypothetical protein
MENRKNLQVTRGRVTRGHDRRLYKIAHGSLRGFIPAVCTKLKCSSVRMEPCRWRVQFRAGQVAGRRYGHPCRTNAWFRAGVIVFGMLRIVLLVIVLFSL